MHYIDAIEEKATKSTLMGNCFTDHFVVFVLYSLAYDF